MSISQYGSIKYTGSNPSKLPDGAGDLFYEQDRTRDFAYLLDRVGSAVVDVLNGVPLLVLNGLIVFVDNTHVNIGASVGYAPFTVSLGTSGTIPPATADEDVAAVRIASAAANNVLLTGGAQGKVTASATLDGSTPNNVKLRYVETDSLTRQRAKVAGTWAFTKLPDWAILISPAAPTAYEVLLGTIVGNGSSFMNILNAAALNVFQQLKDFASKLRMEALI